MSRCCFCRWVPVRSEDGKVIGWKCSECGATTVRHDSDD